MMMMMIIIIWRMNLRGKGEGERDEGTKNYLLYQVGRYPVSLGGTL